MVRRREFEFSFCGQNEQHVQRPGSGESMCALWNWENASVAGDEADKGKLYRERMHFNFVSPTLCLVPD